MSSGWIPCVRTTRQSCSLFCVKPKTEPGTGPRAGRPREASTHTRFYVCVCLYRFLLCWIPRILTHQLARTALRMLCSGSNEILQPTLWPVKSQRGCEVLRCEAIMCCSRSQSIAWRHLAWLAEAQLIVRKSLSAVCSHHPVETTEGPISIVALTSVLTCAHSGVRFSAPLCGWHINPKEIVDSRITFKPVSWTLFWLYFAFVYLLNEVSVAWLWTNKAAEHFVWHQWNVECQLATVLRGKENVPGSSDISLESLFRLGHP